MADEIRIELIADAKGVVRAVEKIAPAASRAGKKAADNIERPLKNTGDRLRSSFVAIGAILGTALAGKKFIDAAAEQERVVEKLNASLKNTGNFSEATSKSLQSFAASIEMSSTVSDEAVLDQLAFAQAMGASVEQSKKIVKASIEYSKATGTDLNAAVRQISKTLGGFGGELSEVIPAMKNLTQEQLRAGAGVDLMASKYKGFSEAELKTFGGAILFLQNALGTASEKIGEAVVKSPVLIKAIRLIGEGIQNTFGKFPVPILIKGLNEFILILADTADALSILTQPIVNIGRIFSLMFSGVKTGFQSLIVLMANGLNTFVDAMPSFIKKFLPIEEIQTATDAANNVLDGFTNETNNKLNTLLEHNTSFSDSIRNSISDFRNSLHESAEISNQALINSGESLDKNKDKIVTIYDGLIKKQKDFAKQTKLALVQHAASAFSQGFSAMGRAVATGANAFEAGMNAILGSFGGALAQLGQGYFLQGLAMLFAGQPGGSALMVQGAALSTFGGFLSAKFGGGAGGTSAVGSAGAVSATDDPLTGAIPVENIAADEPEEIEKQQQVQLIVQGDVFDHESTGTKILEILNEEFDNKGGRIAYA